MEQEKIKAYYQMWSEAWKLFRKWAINFTDTDDFWQNAIKEADEFCRQHSCKLASIIVVDILDELQKQAVKGEV